MQCVVSLLRNQIKYSQIMEASVNQTTKTGKTLSEKIHCLISENGKSAHLTPQEVFDLYSKNNRTPWSGEKFQVSDAYGHCSVLCRTTENLNTELSRFPSDTIFKTEYHPMGIRFTPQTKSQKEIAELQDYISNF